MPRIKFSPENSGPLDAIVVSFDLTGFSEFCNRPDAHVVLPRFLSRLFDELNEFLMGGWGAALENLGEFVGAGKERRKVVKPEFIKFTGDGAIMLWLTGWDGKFSDAFCTALVGAMRNLRARIATIVPVWEKEWRVVGLPRRARFGIAAGSVYPLKEPSVTLNSPIIDFVGHCINLAVRLQDHCPEVGFLVHKTVHPLIDGLLELEAVGIKGTRNEPVLVFASDLQDLPNDYLKTKFRPV